MKARTSDTTTKSDDRPQIVLAIDPDAPPGDTFTDRFGFQRCRRHGEFRDNCFECWDALHPRAEVEGDQPW